MLQQIRILLRRRRLCKRKQAYFPVPPKIQPVSSFDRFTRANCFDCWQCCPFAGGYFVGCSGWVANETPHGPWHPPFETSRTEASHGR